MRVAVMSRRRAWWILPALAAAPLCAAFLPSQFPPWGPADYNMSRSTITMACNPGGWFNLSVGARRRSWRYTFAYSDMRIPECARAGVPVRVCARVDRASALSRLARFAVMCEDSFMQPRQLFSQLSQAPVLFLCFLFVSVRRGRAFMARAALIRVRGPCALAVSAAMSSACALCVCAWASSALLRDLLDAPTALV